ncbi:MAG: HNH endonuclease signature motif containing protein, partial [Nocardioides sp.]|nr:HNH endonuclease signature motif containing protein [Nocardioides sp.]
ADAVDAHDPPEWMRELVILRDRTCVFPGCRTSARRSDLDHIEPYVPPDDGGPPGQTRPENLAALCRRHHRLKTHSGWTYRRAGEGYTWDPPARAA